MTVSLVKPSDFRPGRVVKTTYALNPDERNCIGYVQRTDHRAEQGEVRVRLLDGEHKGASLIFNLSSLTFVK